MWHVQMENTDLVRVNHPHASHVLTTLTRSVKRRQVQIIARAGRILELCRHTDVSVMQGTKKTQVFVHYAPKEHTQQARQEEIAQIAHTARQWELEAPVQVHVVVT